ADCLVRAGRDSYNSLDYFPGSWRQRKPGIVSHRPRILVLEGPAQSAGSILQNGSTACDLVRVDNLAQGLELLRTERFEGVYADTKDPTVREWAGNLLQAERIFKTLPDGVAVVNADLRILWANTAFEAAAGGAVVGRSFYDALGSPE